MSVILDKAKEIVYKGREQEYGSPEDNFGMIACFWSLYLSGRYKSEVLVRPEDVAIMMDLLKTARIATGRFNLDNFIDKAGYTECAARILTKDEKCSPSHPSQSTPQKP